MKTIIIAAIIIGAVVSLLTVSSLNTTPFILCSEGYDAVGEECVRIQCSENHVIYQNNCVGIASENVTIFDATVFFKSVDGKIIEYCQVEFRGDIESENCLNISRYAISDENIIELEIECDEGHVFVEKKCAPNLADTEIWSNYSRPYDGTEPEPESHWRITEDHCQDFCDQNESYEHGCSEPLFLYLHKYTNLLDEDFDGTFVWNTVGLPDGVSQENFDECTDFIYESRISIESESAHLLCVQFGGDWLEEFRECENLVAEQCMLLGGEYSDCEFECRHHPDYPNVECHLECVPVCSVE